MDRLERSSVPEDVAEGSNDRRQLKLYTGMFFFRSFLAFQL